jgi:hypothetical protein
MSANSKIQLTNIDFDALKSSLKSFLQNQSQFSDYNFEGAALDILLDILAYNTHYSAFYLNMVANEMFLDTAVLRQTVVSHAKSLGYTPKSATAAQAFVNLIITKANSDPTTLLILPRFTSFAAQSLSGNSYNFVTLDDVSVQVDDTTFTYNNVEIVEGAPTIKSFLVDNSTNPSQIFDLLDQSIDTSTIQVVVQQSPTNILQTNFTLAQDSTEVGATDNVYFLQEGTDGNYQIYFGDGVIGAQLDNGAVVIVSYVITSADAANGLSVFQLKSNVLSGSTSNTVGESTSAGGSPIEDVASIKFAAPKAYIAQNRAVTKNDYVALINKNYPFFDAVTIWGGDEEVPPVYGKVFISAKPMDGFAITEAQKQFVIDNIIKPISILTVTPEFVDVDYNYLVLNLNVEYNSQQTTASAGQIISFITNAVNNYANLNLNTFNSEFRLSRMLRAIDDSEQSILSSTATIYIEKQFTPVLNASSTITLNVGFPLHRGTVGDGLFSTPAVSINDLGGVSRQSFVEEVPNSFSGVEEVDILTSGSGYVTAPTLTVVGDGTGANVYAIIVNSKVASVVIDNPGSEYSTATITSSGGGGSGATFSASLEGKTGLLRTYYFDTNQNKVILNTEAGNINYANGIITLNNFAPTAISNTSGILKILVQPDILSFSSSKQQILTIDPNDINAITVTLTDEATV